MIRSVNPATRGPEQSIELEDRAWEDRFARGPVQAAFDEKVDFRAVRLSLLGR